MFFFSNSLLLTVNLFSYHMGFDIKFNYGVGYDLFMKLGLLSS